MLHPQQETQTMAKVKRPAAPYCTPPTTGEEKQEKNQGYRKKEKWKLHPAPASTVSLTANLPQQSYETHNFTKH